jgi:hypothetical protein
MWKEAAISKFDVIYRNVPAGTKGNHESFSQNSMSPDQRLNPRTHRFEAEVSPTEPFLITDNSNMKGMRISEVGMIRTQFADQMTKEE